MKLLCFMLLIIGSTFHNANAQLADVWEEIDVRYYYPKEAGLRDVAFSVRKSGLAKMIKENFFLKNVKDVYVQVYFLFPDRYQMRVHGIPDGFMELRRIIKGMISPYLEFVFPVKFTQKYQGFAFQKTNKQGQYILKGKDPKYQSAIPEFDIYLSDSNVILKTVANTPQGPNTTKFKYTKKRWSNNKNVLEKIESITKTRMSTNTMSTDIIYAKENGIGLPRKITVQNKVELLDEVKKLPQFKDQKSKWTEETVITFDSFEVNKNRAKNIFHTNKKNVQ